MKPIRLIVLLISFILAGCVAKDQTFCPNCDVHTRDLKIQEQKDLYPENSQIVNGESGMKYTVTEHTRQMTQEYKTLIPLVSLLTFWPIFFVIPMYIFDGVEYNYGIDVVSETGQEEFIKYSDFDSLNILSLVDYTKREEKRVADEKAYQDRQKKRQEERKKQAAKEKEQMLSEIADCEQAVEKAVRARTSISSKPLLITLNGRKRVTAISQDGLFYHLYNESYVSDFANDGVFISRNDRFIYTSDTDYATGDKFRSNDFIYEKVGNYKYRTIAGNINSVPAYRATKHKISEILPLTYLKNKKALCCQYDDKEVGVVRHSWYDDNYCKTRNHINGKSGYAKEMYTDD